MWPYGGSRAVPRATQNLTVSNSRRCSQNPIHTTYMPYAANPSYLPQEPIGYMTYIPYPQYSQQDIGYTTYAPYPLYLQQEIGARLSQDPMANDVILQDRNWLFQNHYKNETMPEYKNGEVVMVRCNQHKWLPGVIQRISTQGVRIWITDANILVNVPLVLLSTHVIKMSMYLELGTLPQVEPMWIASKNRSYQEVLMQCVRPAHLSHHKLFRVLENNICAICKNLVSNTTDIVNPWNCYHQVHNYCLQFQTQQSPMAMCPSCNKSTSREHMFLAYSNNAFASPSNGQQRWFNFQCVCGFKTTIASISNMEVPMFCPNCQQHLNINTMQSGANNSVNPMTIEMQSFEPRGSIILNPRTIRMQSASTNILRAYSESKRENFQSLDSLKAFEKERFFNAQDFGSGWPIQSFNCSNRLEAIEEGREGYEPKFSLEPLATNKYSSYFPSRFETLCKTFENNNIYDSNVVAMRPNGQDLQRPSSSPSSWHDGSYYEPFRNESDLIQNIQYSNSHNLLKDDIVYEPSQKSSLILNKKYSNSQSLLDDGSLEATLPFSPTLMKIEQSVSRSLLQHGSMSAPSIAPISLIQNEQSRHNTLGPLATPTLASHMNLAKVEEANEAMEKLLEMDKTTIKTIEGYNLWKRANEPNTSIIAIEGPKIWKKKNEPNTTIIVPEVQKLLKRTSEPNTTLAIVEGQEVLEKANESNPKIVVAEAQKRASQPNTNIAVSEVQKVLKKMMSEPNTTIVATKDQQLWKNASETNTTIKDLKVWKRTSEPNMTNATTNDKSYWEKASKAIAIHEGQQFWWRENKVNSNEDEENGDIKRVSSSNDFLASSSSAAPLYMNYFDEGQKSWRRPSVVDWTIEHGNDEENEETIDIVTPNTTPMYINHFVDFVKLAMAGSSTAKDIIASASPTPSSPSTSNLPSLESGSSAWSSPPPVFFTRASALFTETTPAWVTLNKDLEQADWITVIKDGVDSRKDDKRWELERLARTKDSEFL